MSLYIVKQRNYSYEFAQVPSHMVLDFICNYLSRKWVFYPSFSYFVPFTFEFLCLGIHRNAQK